MGIDAGYLGSSSSGGIYDDTALSKLANQNSNNLQILAMRQLMAENSDFSPLTMENMLADAFSDIPVNDDLVDEEVTSVETHDAVNHLYRTVLARTNYTSSDYYRCTHPSLKIIGDQVWCFYLILGEDHILAGQRAALMGNENGEDSGISLHLSKNGLGDSVNAIVHYDGVNHIISNNIIDLLDGVSTLKFEVIIKSGGGAAIYIDEVDQTSTSGTTLPSSTPGSFSLNRIIYNDPTEVSGTTCSLRNLEIYSGSPTTPGTWSPGGSYDGATLVMRSNQGNGQDSVIGIHNPTTNPDGFQEYGSPTVYSHQEVQLESNMLSSNSVPNYFRAYLIHRINNGICILNTDFVFSVQRDGAFVPGTLTEVSQLDNGLRIYATEEIDLSAQNGNDFIFLVSLAGNSEQELHALSLAWRS